MGKLIALLVMVAALGGGVGAGFYLRPDAPPPEMPADHAASDMPKDAVLNPAAAPASPEYYEISEQFIVPLVAGTQAGSVMLIKLALEISPGARNAVSHSMPRLRDRFLRAMFDHANSAGFDGAFTSNGKLDQLRRALDETAIGVLGPEIVNSVMITDIIRASGQ